MSYMHHLVTLLLPAEFPEPGLLDSSFCFLPEQHKGLEHIGCILMSAHMHLSCRTNSSGSCYLSLGMPLHAHSSMWQSDPGEVGEARASRGPAALLGLLWASWGSNGTKLGAQSLASNQYLALAGQVPF